MYVQNADPYASQVRSPQKQSQVVESEPQDVETHPSVRYLRKLFFLILVQLGFATYLCSFAVERGEFATWITDYKTWTFYVSLVVLILISLAVLFIRQYINRSPVNFILYLLHTISFALVASYIEIETQNDDYLYYGLQFFTLVVFSLFVHAIFTSQQTTFRSVALYILGAVYLATVLFEVFNNISASCLHTLAILSIVWGFYLVWENNALVGDKNQWADDDYFTGAVGVYIFVVFVFVKLVEYIRNLFSRK